MIDRIIVALLLEVLLARRMRNERSLFLEIAFLTCTVLSDQAEMGLCEDASTKCDAPSVQSVSQDHVFIVQTESFLSLMQVASS